MPWDRWLRHGLGALRWSPVEFWAATPIELYRAVEGWLEARGIDPEKPETQAPPTAPTLSELHDLMERFPD